jgi:phosphoglycerate kinase
MHKQTVRDIDVRGKRVLLRVDFNVPVNDVGEITDDSRIRLSLPTIGYLREHGAAVIACSHFGRPDGKVVEKYRLTAVRKRLSELIGTEVVDAGGPGGPQPGRVAQGLKPGQVALLENLRFDPGEEANSPAFAQSLASLGDIYVDDAFAAAHRAHASVSGVTRFLPAVAGLLMAREIQMLGAALDSPAKPAVAVVGGAKVADKLQVLTHLAAKVDVILVGGGMVAAFLRAAGHSSGSARVTAADVQAAQDLLASLSPLTHMPRDVVVATSFSADAPATVVDDDKVPVDALVLDIGPVTRRAYASDIARARSVIWNGPMGVFEWPQFAEGTKAVAQAIAANRQAVTVVGGGATAEAVEKLGIRDRFTHVSTGGGASLEFLEGKVLPGVAALLDR